MSEFHEYTLRKGHVIKQLSERQRGGAHQKPTLLNPDLGLLASRTVRKLILWFKPHSLWYFALWQHEQTNALKNWKVKVLR